MRTRNKLTPIFISLCYLLSSICYGQENLPKTNQESTSNSTHTGRDVFERLNRNFKPLECNDKSAQIWLKTYSRHKDFSDHLISVMPMLDYVSREFEQLNLPSEYTLVPFIESRYNPSARSKAGPGGLWQMISSTAIHLGVKVNAQYDGRYSPVDSTRGAIKYFTELSKTFTGWQTILMAYNAGGSRLRSALKKQGLKSADIQKKLPSGLAPHTYVYIQKIQAIACLIAEPARYNISLPNNVEFTPLVTIEFGEEFSSLDDVEKKLNISHKTLFDLNPSYRHLKHSKSAPGIILVPDILNKDSERILNQGN